MKNRTIGIIGIGPRGLSVLERIIALSIDTPHQPLDITVFDPNLQALGVMMSNNRIIYSSIQLALK
ncbi:hypothetical protein CSB62_12425 [Vibrio splendidus]|uniref:FAD-dependent urate hydroxylase HpyO/Asp monooxygenase CreE-like FAD/NAD(P)-binding domain-containing protein n=1 Tax=Vibrio lentus TaxID=136468 RepID=A0A855IM83_9VIBR|nr:FAD/NAD(P)-binding protein [Vibrio lentus]PHN85686.1 hypothetical protein CSB62_12425 [Vibrio splendidus]MCB5362079.1 FAD/NAD(P)-binding protein [Vibrio lentus]MCB5452245.1 FAD/NAD(P)-binding protein [Vibrio lentus]MCB5464448.1 FAD/NAD(P)-binding protein [Vibrio lentus]MCC5486082.1 FAD/NAD(P)-binding protein [Vibrio lentus]